MALMLIFSFNKVSKLTFCEKQQVPKIKKKNAIIFFICRYSLIFIGPVNLTPIIILPFGVAELRFAFLVCI